MVLPLVLIMGVSPAQELDALEMEKEEEVEGLRLRNIFLKAQVRIQTRPDAGDCAVLLR